MAIVSRKDYHPERPKKNSSRTPIPGGVNPDEMANIGPFEYGDGSRARWPDAPYEHYSNNNIQPVSHSRRQGNTKDESMKSVQDSRGNTKKQFMKSGTWQQAHVSPRMKLKRAAVREGMADSFGTVLISKSSPRTGWIETKPDSPLANTKNISHLAVRRMPTNRWQPSKKNESPRAEHTLKMNGWINTKPERVKIKPGKKTKSTVDSVFGDGEAGSAIDQLDAFETSLIARAEAADKEHNTHPKNKMKSFPCSGSNTFPSCNLDERPSGSQSAR